MVCFTLLPIVTTIGDVQNEIALYRLPLLGVRKAIVDDLEERKSEISWTAIDNGPFFDR